MAHLSKFQAVQKVSKTWFTGNWSNDAERTSSTVWKTCQKARCGRWSCSTSSSLWYLGSAMNIFPQCAPWPGVCYCAGRLGPGREMVSLIPASLAQILASQRKRPFIDFSPTVSSHVKRRLPGRRSCGNACILRHLGQQATRQMLFCLIFQILLPLLVT